MKYYTKSQNRGGNWFDKINPWTKKTLKNKIHNYICKKDICCEEDINRKVVIRMILKHYKKRSVEIGESNYLNAINNDLVKFIGYKVDLEKKNDKIGLELWKEIDEQTSENNEAIKDKIKLFLEEVPLFFLLAFLGYSEYTKKVSNI